MGWFGKQARAAAAVLAFSALTGAFAAAEEPAPAEPAAQAVAEGGVEAQGDAAMEGEAEAARVNQLARQLRFALFRETACPGQEQALRIISEVIDGWDLETAGSALQLLAAQNQLCPAVGAVLATARGAVQTAQMAQSRASGEANAPAAGDTIGGTPGGEGGPGYRGTQ